MAPSESVLCPNGHIVDKKKEGLKLHQILQRHSCGECHVDLPASATRYRCRGHCNFDLCEACFAKKNGVSEFSSSAGVVAWAARPRGSKYEIGDLWLKSAVRSLSGVPENASCGAAGNAVDGKAPPAREERGSDAAGAREADDAGSATGRAAEEGETGPGSVEASAAVSSTVRPAEECAAFRVLFAKEGEAGPAGGNAGATGSSSVRPAEEGKPTPKSGEDSAADSGRVRPAEGGEAGPGSGEANAPTDPGGGEASTSDSGEEACATVPGGGEAIATNSLAPQRTSSLRELTPAEKERRAILKLGRNPGAVRKCIGKLKLSMSLLEAKQQALDLRCQADVSRETRGLVYAAHWRCTTLQEELKGCVNTLERLHAGCPRDALTGPFERAGKAQETCYQLLEECNALEAAD